MRKVRPWTDEETELARAHYTRAISPADFFRLVGRTKDAAGRRLEYIDRPEVREKHLRKMQMYRDAAKASGVMNVAARKVDAPPELIEEAARRAKAPRSITASIMGDPPPGFSALDRR